MIGDKTFYYGNDNTQNDRKIIAGLLADTDLYLNEEKKTTDIIDTYNISEFLEDNKNLYKNINLGYDPYEEKDIDKKGNSYLRTYYNKEISLINLRKSRDDSFLSYQMNSIALNKINKNMKTISILGLIACVYLLIGFIVIIRKEYREYHSINECYSYFIFVCLALILTPLIFVCINIDKIKEAEKIDPEVNFKIFKILSIVFIIYGFILYLFLIFLMVFFCY